MMITLESISKKLGYNPLRHDYGLKACEDDNWENPFKDLTLEEIDFIFHAAVNDPMCYARNQKSTQE